MATLTEDTPEADRLAISAARAANLAKVLEGYEVQDPPDSSVPGARAPREVNGVLRYHPRYVLMTQYGDRGNYRATLGASRADVESIAAHLVTDADGAEQPVCYFDLDELAGPEPTIYDGDVVGLENETGTVRYVVERIEEEVIEGELERHLLLVTEGRKSTNWDDWDECVHEDDVTVIERGEEDERMPVRYGLAKIIVSVVFNTEPSPA